MVQNGCFSSSHHIFIPSHRRMMQVNKSSQLSSHLRSVFHIYLQNHVFCFLAASLPPVLIWCMCVYAHGQPEYVCASEDWAKGPQLLWTHCDHAAGRAFPRVLAVPSFMAHGGWKGPQSNLSRDHELHPLLPFVTTDDAYVVCPLNCYRRTVLWFMALASDRGLRPLCLQESGAHVIVE